MSLVQRLTLFNRLSLIRGGTVRVVEQEGLPATQPHASDFQGMIKNESAKQPCFVMN